jgi:hypothetical protein
MQKILLGVFGLVVCAAVAWAQERTKQATVYESVSGKTVLEILSAEGYKPTLEKDSDGDPKLTFKVQGKTVGLFFYGCKKTPFCTALSLSSGWDLKTPLNATKLLGYNFDTRFIRAGIDSDNDPYLEADLDVVGGVTEAAIKAWIETYTDQLADFRSTFKL